MWRTERLTSEQLHVLLMVLGFALLVGAAILVQLGTSRNNWPVASAHILSVSVKCQIRPMEYSYRGSARRPFFMGCDQVAKFREDNPDRIWSVSRLYEGAVRIVRNGVATELVMDLTGVGNQPKVGQSFVVVQNPDFAAEVALPERSLTETLAGAAIGGLGLFVLAAAFFLT